MAGIPSLLQLNGVPPMLPLNCSNGAMAKPRNPKPPATLPQKNPPAPAHPQKAMTSPGTAPLGARIHRRASDRLRNGHLWVYASDIEEIQAPKDNPPALLPIADNRGILLGTALYSPNSQIALRLISHELITESQWHQQLAARLRAAIARRKPLLTEDTNACRLVFSEADDLPGIVIDQYANLVILQLLTRGLDNTETRAVCTRVLREELSDEITLWERPDPRIRELEGLSAPSPAPLYTPDAANPATSAIFRLNGLSFHFDAGSGQKTGAFLDQRQNYAAAQSWAKARGAKRALDVCTYQGGFALHLARVCEKVTGIDASRASLEVAERNLELNRSQLSAEVDWLEADAFDILRDWSSTVTPDNMQDLIVLDPPAFAKSKRAVEGALRGYKELNLRAIRMLRKSENGPGGLLITCSCSHHISLADLESAVTSASIDAHRRVTLLERRGASHDHPVILTLPETEYLKCLICQID